jgi:tripeptide aminopeptidase
VTRASDAERRRLHEDFARLCAVASPSGSERACAELVRTELGRLGIEVDEDDAGALTGGDCGNLLARVPGTAGTGSGGGGGAPTILICTHLDTVPPTGAIEPVLIDGGWINGGDGILGADNKAAVAVALALARHLVAVPAAVGLELLFTVSEEDALAGAKAFDATRLRSAFGYTFDHATPIGEIVTSSPTYYRVVAEFAGLAAHAGIRPEDGRSAVVAAARAVASMRLGRLDAETTANVGTIDGGTAANVVPGRCRVVGEARSIDPVKAEQAVTDMVDRLGDAANSAGCECDLDVTVERLFDGYRTPRTARQVRVAEDALRDCGYEPRAITTGGGSDANVLVARGFAATNLANGTERNHQPDERVSAAALEGMLDVGLALVRRAAGAVAPVAPAAG